MESIIKWQTGEPNLFGTYLVTLRSGIVCVDNYEFETDLLYEKDTYSWQLYREEVVAWCKLRDIEPYKEE